MPKICGITTLPGTIKSFMLENLEYMTQNGYEAYCISSPGNELNKNNLGDVKYIPISEMKWGIMSPVALIKCVKRLYDIFRKEKFDIIQYATSNAALCASIAGWMAQVPVRINCQWGISYPVFKGLKRLLFYYSTILICRLSTSVQPDSKANLKFSIENKLYPASKGLVLFNGSACGVNLEKYNFLERGKWRSEIFDKYQLWDYDHVFGFVGRVVVEKGINELLEAFIRFNDINSCLMIIGNVNDVGRLNQDLWAKIQQMKNVYIIGPVCNPEQYYAAFDFLLLPSYQEGFGMTILEAAGVGTPSIVTNIKGPTDLINDGVNGFICKVKSVDSLITSFERASNLSDEQYCAMSNTAYKIAKDKFDSKRFKEIFFEDREYRLNNVNLK